MATSKLTVNVQVRRLNDQQQAIYRKLRRLAPEGTIENAPTNSGALLTWQSTWQAVSNAAACLEDLAQDSIIDDLVQVEKRQLRTPLPRPNSKPPSFRGPATRSYVCAGSE